ncbi:hypothetical protein SUGI_0502580 [Cryptomeria japonica]|nr:hypothetical protein SUGI_0502580 [Cryptomeria japonica]
MDALIAKLWSFIALFTMLRNLSPPPQLYEIVMLWYESLHDYFNPPLYQLDIREVKDNSGVSSNYLYESVQQHLESLQGIAPKQTTFRAKNSCNVRFFPANGEEVEDSFRGVKLRWKHTEQSVEREKVRRSFTLKLAKANKPFLTAYINHITRRAEDSRRENK